MHRVNRRAGLLKVPPLTRSQLQWMLDASSSPPKSYMPFLNVYMAAVERAQLRVAAEDKAVRHDAELCSGHGYQRTGMRCIHSPAHIFPYAGCVAIAAAPPFHQEHDAYMSRQGERMDNGTAFGLNSESQPTHCGHTLRRCPLLGLAGDDVPSTPRKRQ